ncbi:hypothetical protein PHJA_000882900 [Phtheirospermum japonicum]|uniref:Uncharacterized protein n=1 Tax=Phtheirospermum japonicum TaxID=374723 RepID=A0A830BML8_9LAMI|nr:hypothetical protein PHJA_000882900 [Phtheirospermum japonicum]
MATMSRLCYSPPAGGHYRRHSTPTTQIIPKFVDNTFQNNTLFALPSLQLSAAKPIIKPDFLPKLHIPCAAAGGDIGNDGTGDGGSGGGGGGGDPSDDKWDGFGPIGAFINGWRSRVAADPQFPFKVLMEELVGVSACVLGDMASRPNFGLNELDFVFSTLIVGSILNFVLMYVLAPTAISSSTVQTLFAGSPASHMFEPGPYSLLSRFGTLVYKGTLFAIVGFGAGLVGTAISNGLIKMRKRMDPNFETPNKAPPTLLNATTWAVHMGVSANLRYQTLNGIEYLLDKGLPPLVFKTSVVVLRCLNNVLGGMSFVVLARLTGSQSSAVSAVEEEEKGADAAAEQPASSAK